MCSNRSLIMQGLDRLLSFLTSCECSFRIFPLFFLWRRRIVFKFADNLEERRGMPLKGSKICGMLFFGVMRLNIRRISKLSPSLTGHEIESQMFKKWHVGTEATTAPRLERLLKQQGLIATARARDNNSLVWQRQNLLEQVSSSVFYCFTDSPTRI